MCSTPQSCSPLPREIVPLTSPSRRLPAPEAPLRVTFGQATFDAEGSESSSRFFSRQVHWPGGASGVTIGRGYDMGQRTPLQIISELTYAGVSEQDARWLSQAAGLRGESARRFVESQRNVAPEISLEAQKKLFEEITTNETVADIRRILCKPDVIARYGPTAWNDLPQPVQELLFDLRYRGDYTPTTRQVIQPLIARNDLDGLRRTMHDTAFWSAIGVPRERIEVRKQITNSFEASEPARKVA